MADVLPYHYPHASSAGSAGIARAPPTVERPERYFSGFVERPDVVAAALLSVAHVARTRYFARLAERDASRRLV